MNNVNISEYLWTEKYRPQVIEDCVFIPAIKKTFLEIVKKGECQNMLLTGTQGTGKCLGYDTVLDVMVSDAAFEKLKAYQV